MNYEVVERFGRIHIIKNGVESAAFAVPRFNRIYRPDPCERCETLANALELIAARMDDWYTATEAAERLVEMGVFDEAPSAHDVCLWARNGLLPGAIKITGKGGAGRGGSWRIPEKALETLANKRR